MNTYELIAILSGMLANTIVLLWLLGRMDKLERKYQQLKHVIGIQKVNAKHESH